MSVSELVCILRRIKRQSQPKTQIYLSVFTDDGRVPVRVDN